LLVFATNGIGAFIKAKIKPFIPLSSFSMKGIVFERHEKPFKLNPFHFFEFWRLRL